MKKSTANEILDRARKSFDPPSDAQLSVFLGQGRTSISAWRKRNVAPFEALFWKAKEHKIDYNWLITGEVAQSDKNSESNDSLLNAYRDIMRGVFRQDSVRLPIEHYLPEQFEIVKKDLEEAV